MREQFFEEQLGPIVLGIRRAIDQFTNWGIRVAPLGRLRSAEKVLETIRDQGMQGQFEREVILSSWRDAYEFGAIATYAQTQRLKVIAAELDRTLKGTLKRDTKDRTGYQFQSQYMVGAALAAAGADPEVPSPTTGPMPDYLVSIGSKKYGIEVKRPSGRDSLSRNLIKAASQLRESGHPGMVVVDLTDCLGEGRMDLILDESHAAIARAENQFRELVGNLDQIGWDESREDISEIFWPNRVISAYATIFQWQPEGRALGRENWHRAVSYAPKTGQTIEEHVAHWLKVLFPTGYQRVMGTRDQPWLTPPPA